MTPEPEEEVPAARVTMPTRDELDALPADRRLELLALELTRKDTERERRRQNLHQWINSGVLLIGALLAGGSLLATALTLRTGQGELRTAKEGQVTDRYTRATEQLGSPRREVRTAAIYALERITADSPRDRLTIRDVLAAFVREHDPAPNVKRSNLPEEPDADVAAALTVLTRRPPDPPHSPFLDLRTIRAPSATFAPHANLARTDLRDADLTAANLHGADLRAVDLRDGSTLMQVDLSDANLSGAELNSVDLLGANLTRTNLTKTDLRNADLRDADLTGADLRGAHLMGAILHSTTTHGMTELPGANLRNADLRGADLFFTDLHGVDLRGADLRGVQGMTEAEIRKVATVDHTTPLGTPG
jgi:uncharacterized protein YjbI with pentapeptide repeats